MASVRRRSYLEKELNYTNKPGFHSRQSPVVGTRAKELSEIKTIMETPKGYALYNLEIAMYQKRFFYIIPKSQREAANKIAREIFLNYIEKYKADDLTEENCVRWVKSAKPESVRSVTWLNDVKNEFNTWRLLVIVEADNGICNEDYECFLPPHVVALHELMHVEETPIGAPKSFENKFGNEILTAMKTIILLDQIYKMLNDLKVDEIVDYKLELDIAGKKIPLGEFANFYRKLEVHYANLAKAILSPESLSYLPKVDKNADLSFVELEDDEEGFTLEDVKEETIKHPLSYLFRSDKQTMSREEVAQAESPTKACSMKTTEDEKKGTAEIWDIKDKFEFNELSFIVNRQMKDMLSFGIKSKKHAWCIILTQEQTKNLTKIATSEEKARYIMKQCKDGKKITSMPTEFEKILGPLVSESTMKFPKPKWRA